MKTKELKQRVNELKQERNRIQLNNKAYWEGYNAGNQAGKKEAAMMLGRIMGSLVNHKGIGKKTMEKIFTAMEEEVNVTLS